VGEFALYMVVVPISHTFVVFDIGITILFINIPYINPLKGIVINYQNGGD
jgi:hypothetical protein